MVSRPRSSIRPCPVCGIAMQASKSRENLGDFDTFSCLSCETTIVVGKPQPAAGDPNRN
jgi:hypothetical protein